MRCSKSLSAILLLTGIGSMSAAVVVWDDEFTLNGQPNHRWSQPDNWSGDAVPTSADDVRLLSGDLVELLSTNATVKTIEARIPLKIGSSLKVLTSGSFENSLTAGADGTLEAVGPISLTGFNDLRSTKLKGAGAITNQGDVIIGAKGIDPGTSFVNQLNATLDVGMVTLGDFVNQGSFDFGDRGQVTGITNFTNEGLLQKTDNGDLSSLDGAFVQTGGSVKVSEDCFLSIQTDDQQYKGGVMEVEPGGVLVLTGNDNPAHNRTYDGLTSITGIGTVQQIREFRLLKDLEVNVLSDLGFQAGSLVFGKEGQSATFTNKRNLTIDNSPEFVPHDPDNELSHFSNTFVNGPVGNIFQDESSYPAFLVAVENNGYWGGYGMRVNSFENNGLLILRNATVNPYDPNLGGNLTNSKSVLVGEFDSFSRVTINTEYDQTESGRTILTNGILGLEGGSQAFGGEFDTYQDTRLEINRGSYAAESTSGNRVTIKGHGTASIGGSGLVPEFCDLIITNQVGGQPDLLNLSGPILIDPSAFLHWRNGKIIDGSMINEGYLKWGGGEIKGLMQNKALLEVTPGAPHRLNGFLENSQDLYQGSSIFLGTDAEEESYIFNSGLHVFQSGAFLSGGRATDAYVNLNKVRIDPEVSVSISSSFLNKGEVVLSQESVLGLTNCENLDSNGVLSGGKWIVADNAQVILPRTFTRLAESVDWKGPGAKNVNEIDKGSRLTKTTTEVHSVRLEVQGVIALGGGTRTTIPETELQEGGRLEGEGTHVGDVQVGSGVIAPGNSPGELSVEGDLTFTPASGYDWEAASPGEADLVSVILGSVSASGVFRPILLDDYVPAIGQSFTILTAPSITGTFDFVDLSSLPPGLTVNLGYSATSVTLTFAATSLSDFESWRQTRFTPAEQLDDTISGPNADPDGDGILNKAEYAHGLNPKAQEAYPFEVIAATDTTMDLRFPWAAGDHATYEIRTSSEVRNFFPVASELQNTSTDIRPGVDEITVRTSHFGSRAQFSTLVIELAP